MSKIISVSCIFGSNVFFVLLALLGIRYTGVENSNIYIIYTLFITTLSLLLFFHDALMKNRKMKVTLLFIPIIIFEIYLLTMLFSDVSSLASMFFYYYLLWSLPAFFMGIYLSWDNRHEYLFKSLDLILIFGSGAAIISTIFNVIQGSYSQGLAGGTNQTLSYVSAFVFGLNLFLNFSKYNIVRFRFAKNRLYNIFCVILLPFQLLSVIISGGRGGMVLLIIYLILFLIKTIKSYHSVKLSLFIFSVILTAMFFSFSLNNEIFNSGLERSFAYVGSGGLNWDGTSNRDSVYQDAINLIKERPLIGYGLFGYLSYYPNPHNLILEVLLSGGLLYLILFILIVFYISKKYLSITKKNKDMQFIGIIASFPIVMLMFSGTYMVSSELWFVLGFILSYKEKIE
ncbi:O-antigen ligase family protein [Peribacillus frigoritolerans]|uniref:O-antigen ligase family protein n=1 Tax=Peribacillus frigoritolerans TaxID=450367 RepID=UPI001F4FB74F|nr:O-antigen ligase family protein [Peribacillus frigoritolerans]MCK2016878.1 O-antigen ligase family protein [Peribacillus frigoritolerans]